MRKVLVPVDGSASSDRAIRYLIEKRSGLHVPENVEIHLLNVQHPLTGDVSMFIDRDDIKQYHHDEGLKALASARQALDSAGVPYRLHVAVGNPAEVIVQFARENRIDEILMGTHGRSALTHLLLGSVANDVLRTSDIPVMLVK